MPRVASAALARSTVSRRASPRFIGPSATSSKTEPVTPDSWVAGFWNPIPTRVENSWSGLPAIASPSIDSPPPVNAPPIEPGASPEATRHSVDLPDSFGPDHADDLAVGERQVDVVEDGLGVARVAVRDPRERRASPSDPAGEACDRGQRRAARSRTQRSDALPARRRASPRGGGAGRVG